MRRNFLKRFKFCLLFPEKWFCLLPSKLIMWALQTYSIPQQTQFRFWQTSNQVIFNSNIKRNLFGKFKGLSHFLKKIILYSSTRFATLEPCGNIQAIRRFDKAFNTLQNKFTDNSIMGRKIFKSFKTCLTFP